MNFKEVVEEFYDFEQVNRSTIMDMDLHTTDPLLNLFVMFKILSKLERISDQLAGIHQEIKEPNIIMHPDSPLKDVVKNLQELGYNLKQIKGLMRE